MSIPSQRDHGHDRHALMPTEDVTPWDKVYDLAAVEAENQAAMIERARYAAHPIPVLPIHVPAHPTRDDVMRVLEQVQVIGSLGRTLHRYAGLADDQHTAPMLENAERLTAISSGALDALISTVNNEDHGGDEPPTTAPAGTPRSPRGPRGWRSIAATTAGVLGVGTALVGAGAPAQASIVPTAPGVRVVVSGPTSVVTTRVIASKRTTPNGVYSAYLNCPGVSAFGNSRTPLVTITARVASNKLTPGKTACTITDVGDGATRVIPLQVVRQSALSVTMTALDGAVLFTARASHYDANTRSYRGDTYSTVQAQELIAGKWRTIGYGTTDGTYSGLATIIVMPADTGRHIYRAVRPSGANVTGATTTKRVVNVVDAMDTLACTSGEAVPARGCTAQ